MEIDHFQIDYEEISRLIITLKDADTAMRDRLVQNGQLYDGYNKEMEALHNNNADALNIIIDKIGYPTEDKVGRAASEAAWLVIQHAISRPVFMKRCVKLLAQAVDEERADAIHLAYLSDRIATLEGRPQTYGTQFDWDAHGVLSPKPIDDRGLVNKRRKAIGLNTIASQTALIRARASAENESAPSDLSDRKKAYDDWRRRVGWIIQE